jgi:uncharacterized Zn-binding protein involved in type VI secretion
MSQPRRSPGPSPTSPRSSEGGGGISGVPPGTQRPSATVPPRPLIAPTGYVAIDSLADVVNSTVSPFRNPPPPEQGTLGAISQYVGGVVGIVGGAMNLLDTGLALATAGIASLFPALPAATLGALHLAPPHPHAHPPSLVPPAPPIPLPSLGPVMVAGCVSVFLNGIPAARCGDFGIAPTCVGLFPIFEVKTGSSQVFIGGSRAARLLDITSVCVPAPPPMSKAARIFGDVMQGVAIAGMGVGLLGAAANAVGASNSSGQAAADAAMRASMMAAQVAADAAAMAMGALQGKDPGTPASPGVIMPLGGTVLIGGFPMPDTLTALGGLLKAAQMLVKGFRGGRRAGRLFCLRCG